MRQGELVLKASSSSWRFLLLLLLTRTPMSHGLFWVLLVLTSWTVAPKRVLLMFGFIGSSSLLNSFVAWQSNSTRGTVLYGWLQLRHIGGCWGLNRFRWKFNLECPVLSWKMVHWSCLFNKLIQSLGIGFSMWVCITLPVFPSFHLFSHISINLFLIIIIIIMKFISV